ncbi:multicopper oxidase family protein [Paracoccus lutimaris]|uniref:FtsP/CotA-like multicopper oxidase with cupredoxin domain n=1 Tax=Paracoccus lutimaris TaxID=1490030 RepID=A0A368Z3R6_9RHOB|nr:multicopper oxidase domain-containing protein [Paracoccus lutimaris]RCW87100.1 FtsP/CotA-like multicopper oxidase with cupredoxin domain [Paracoccus lutimaris]
MIGRFVSLGFMLLGTQAAFGQEMRTIENPAVFTANPVSLHATTDEVAGFDMQLTYVERQIYNPANGEFQKLHLRGYVDAKATTPPGPDAPIVSPTIFAHPGQTVRLTLHNQLPADPSCGHVPDGNINIPHCFNGTNMHAHGLWVNPSGNGDNVLISLRPGVSFQYEYNIPEDHPAGTYWYHPHLHGSTALQVSSGMAGALIISGDRKPSSSANGDIDTLLIDDAGAPIRNRVLLFQQIQYACGTNPDGTPNYDCKPDQTGSIESYDQFGPGSWDASGRYTSINGRVLGDFDPATVGAVERWRLIHAGVRDTINFEIRPKIGDAEPENLTAQQNDSWIEKNCGPKTLNYHLIAQDGLTMSAAQTRMETILQPGYRADLLVVFPTAGEYCVIDAPSPSAANINQGPPNRRLLALVTAQDGTAVSEDLGSYLTKWLVAATKRNMPQDIAETVANDLRDGLKLTRFVPHPDIGASEVTGTQELVFNIDTSIPHKTVFQIDGQPYAADRIDRTLMLGGVDEWKLSSNFVSHPFHIHVNPFQVVSILDANGNDVSAAAASDAGDPQYPGLKGVWKDTLMVKNLGTSPKGKYTITIRTRYQRYIGEFVLHCHILDHEDQGMMQNIRIAIPDGTGGVVGNHH